MEPTTPASTIKPRSWPWRGQSDAIIYTIGLFDEGDPDQRFDVLKQLAKAAGGEAFLPASVKDVIPGL